MDIKRSLTSASSCQEMYEKPRIASSALLWRKTMAKKTKRKLAHPKLPIQRHLNLQHDGQYFDLRAIFDQLNARYFRSRLRGYQRCLGPQTQTASERIFHLRHDPGRGPRHPYQSVARSAIRAALVHSIHHVPRDAALGRPGRDRGPTAGGACIPKNSTAARSSSAVTPARGSWEEENLELFLR